jgi:hypothetical protein
MFTISNTNETLSTTSIEHVSSTWLKAMDAGNFAMWPGLTVKFVKKHLIKSIATARGHLWQTPQNIRSTQPRKTTAQPSIAPLLPRTFCVYMQQVTITGQIHSNQTGRFPITSSCDSKYIMVVYDYDSNAILAKPLKSWTEHKLLCAYTKLQRMVSNPCYNDLTRKPLDNSNSSRVTTTSSFNSSRPTTTAKMQPKKRLEHGKTTLSQGSAALTQISPCTTSCASHK